MPTTIIYIYTHKGWHDTCIRTEPSRYGPLGSVHEALRWIKAIHPNPEGGARSNATLFDNRQQKNSKCRELRAWKQSPVNSDHGCIR